jgi:hypothetical protein
MQQSSDSTTVANGLRQRCTPAECGLDNAFD